MWVFSDSLSAVKKVKSQLVGLNHQGVFVSNILNLLESGRFSGVCHVRRNANRVAHSLSHFALSQPSPSC